MRALKNDRHMARDSLATPADFVKRQPMRGVDAPMARDSLRDPGMKKAVCNTASTVVIGCFVECNSDSTSGERDAPKMASCLKAQDSSGLSHLVAEFPTQTLEPGCRGLGIRESQVTAWRCIVPSAYVGYYIDTVYSSFSLYAYFRTILPYLPTLASVPLSARRYATLRNDHTHPFHILTMPAILTRATAASLLSLHGRWTASDLRKAYRQAALQCHPDKAGISSADAFQRIQDAYELLQGDVGMKSRPISRDQADADDLAWWFAQMSGNAFDASPVRDMLT